MSENTVSGAGDPNDEAIRRVESALHPHDIERADKPVEGPGVEDEYTDRVADALVTLRDQQVDAHKRALAPSVELLSDVSAAPRLAMRHDSRLLGHTFTSQVAEYDRTQNPECIGALHKMADDANANGFFVLPYSNDLMRHRIESRYRDDPQALEYLVMEASGTYQNKRVAAADCQIHIPDILEHAKHVIELPGVRDEIFDSEWVAEAREHPASIALIEDIVCTKEMQNRGLASFAMNAALSHLAGPINSQRSPEEKIRCVVACIGSMVGIRKPDGTDIRLRRDLGGISPIGNGRSVYLFNHFKSPLWSPFSYACKLADREYPILLEGDTEELHHSLIMSWFEYYSQLRQH